MPDLFGDGLVIRQGERPKIDAKEALAGAARDALTRYEEAHERFTASTVREMELDERRPLEKADAIARMQALAEADGRKLSYSKAEETVEGEPQYAEFLKLRRDVVFARLRAHGDREGAALRFQLVLSLMRQGGDA